jgi:hypothetical protein
MTVTIEQESTTGTREAPPLDQPGEIANVSEPQPFDVESSAAAPPLAEEPQKPTANPIYIYATIAVILGIMLGGLIAAVAWQRSGRDEPAALSPATSSETGLTGHLVLNWADRLGYHLDVEPTDPLQHAAFSLAVSNSPRPVSFDVQLKDSTGSTLCNKIIVMKFDPRQALALAASNGGPQNGALNAGNASAAQIAQGFDVAQAEATELKREYGQDIFRSNIGADGQPLSINSQGELPCSKQAYERAASWSFSSNFLTLGEQAELLKRQSDASADSATADAAKTAPAHRRKPQQKVPPPSVAFGIEGDDELVSFDSSRGIVDTSTRRFFVIGKPVAADNAAAWQDIPADVHYKCYLNGMCSLRRRGAAVLYVQWKR